MKWMGRGFLFGMGLTAGFLVCKPPPEGVRGVAGWLEKYAAWLDSVEDRAYERQGRILAKHLRD